LGLVGCYLLYQKNWPAIKSLVLGAIISFLLICPYLYWEVKNNFQNTHAITQYFGQEHSQYFDRVSKPYYIFKFFPVFFEKVFFNFELPIHIAGNTTYFIGSSILILSLLKTYRGLPSQKNRSSKLKTYLLLLVFFVSIAIMLRIYKGDKIEYYMSTLFLWPFILLTFVLDALRKYKRIFFLIVALLMAYSGWKLSFKLPFNQLEETKQVFSYLDEYSPTRTVNFLFHDDDHSNTIAYGLTHFSSLKYDPSSQTVIDVCNWNQSCVWNTLAQAQYGLAYTAIANYKSQSEYRFVNRFTQVHPFQVVIGTVNSDTQLDTSSYLYQGEYGSDFLLNMK